MGAIALICLFSVLIIANLSWFFSQQIGRTLPPKPLAAKVKQETLDKHSPMFTVAIFGQYQAPLSEAEIKQSTLDLQLVGIMFSSDEKHSQVLIRGQGGEEKVYGLGDTLPGGAKIKQIGKNGIVVLYQGALESLSLLKNALLFQKPAKPLIKE